VAVQYKYLHKLNVFDICGSFSWDWPKRSRIVKI